MQRLKDKVAVVTRAGRGSGSIPVRCDHTDDAGIHTLFERVEREQERLDLLVNNAWGGYEDYDGTFDSPFWTQPLKRWDKMLTAGIRSTMATTI